MNEKLSFIIKLLFVSITVWLLTILLFTDEVIFNRPTSDTEAVSSSDLSDGQYTGFADGHNDSVAVDVIVENGEITQVDVIEHSETEGIADPALNQIPSEIINSNSTEVEIITGATYTSEAIIDAVNNALTQDN